MSIREVVRRVAVTTAALTAAGTFAALAFTSTPAGAATGGGTVSPQGTVAPGPFDSGQATNVSVPNGGDCYATSTPCFTAASGNNSAAITIVECSTPNGVYPTKNIASFCDGWSQQGPTVLPNSMGGVSFQGYTILALPDTAGGETGGTITCGSTVATECSLYIGDGIGNDGLAHVWSQPFLVNTDPTDSGTVNPGDGTPEVPLAIMLPLAALGALGGTVAIRRRRAAKAAR